MLTLADLQLGQTGTVTGFADMSGVTQRLMELGLIQGTPVTFVRRAPAGDPLEFRIIDYSLSIRRSEAALVEVEIIQ